MSLRTAIIAAVLLTAACMMVQAEPVAESPTDCQPAAEPALAALNSLRASARMCGATLFAAAAALRWDARLHASARSFAEELARRDTLSHQGQVLRSLRERLRTSGYVLRSAGENLAAGPTDLDEALQHWLLSREHCENLMLADFRDVGLACVSGPGRYERFWVLHLGRSVGE